MFLTNECDYGIRIIRALASGEKSTAEEICAAESIPGQFAYKILKKLERAGWLRSSRGRDGGYWLVVPPDKLTVYDVVTSIDSNLFINECLRDEKTCVRNHPSHPCAMHDELERIQNALVAELKRYPISEILAREKDAKP